MQPDGRRGKLKARKQQKKIHNAPLFRLPLSAFRNLTRARFKMAA
jgi:hypothetical protein